MGKKKQTAGETHPIVAALDAYQTKEARVSYDPRSLGAPDNQAEYLKNRIDAAFIAGWDAREAHTITLSPKPAKGRK